MKNLLYFIPLVGMYFLLGKRFSFITIFSVVCQYGYILLALRAYLIYTM